MKRISIFILSLLTCIGMFGQGYETNFFPVMTPEAATLGKFGAYPVSHYTGSVDIKIPLYTLESNGIKIPIYLQYDGGGFIPNKDCGKVGHDWSLMTGGVITRTVNGVPDEWNMNENVIGDYDLEGSLYRQRENIPITNNDIKSLESIPRYNSNYENTPDIFSFNFGEHHGQFMIDHDGTVKVIGGGSYKVDINGLAIQEINVITQESYIVITTGDGTKYTFGGSVDALDVSLRMHQGATDKENSTSYPCKNGVITAFHLSEIETIDGQRIYFCYKPSSFKNTGDSEGGYESGQDIIRSTFFSDSKLCIYQKDNQDAQHNDKAINPSFSYTHVAFLESINSNNGTIYFNYEVKAHPFTKSENSAWNTNGYRLDNIQVFNLQGDMIRNIEFIHSYNQSYDYKFDSENNSYRMFLDSIKINRDVYSFSYNLSNIKLPLPHTRGIDLEGFYNGMDNNISLLTYDGVSRQPIPEKAQYGMLTKITYPTGGYTKLTFENHQYGTMIQKLDTSHQMTSSTINGVVGGLRIKKIENVPGDTIVYEYVTENGTSSGVYNNVKQYDFLLSYGNIQLDYTTIIYNTTNNLIAGNGISESNIVYSRIIETRGTGKGKKVYYYTTYNDYKDEPILEHNLNYFFFSTRNSTGEKESDLAKKSSCLVAYTSKHLERGKLLKVEDYKTDGSLLQRISYTYNTNTARTSQAIYSSSKYFSVSPIYEVATVVAHYYYPNQLSKQVVESYDGGTQQTVTEYTYHQTTRELVKETVTNSNGVVQGKKLYYPQDVNGYDEMVNNNQIAHVVKEEQFVGSESNVVKTLEYVYGEFNNAYYDLACVKEKIGNNAQQELLTITARDSHRNVLEAKELGKPTTCYLWGYNHQYPVAKLVNSSLSELMSTNTQNLIAIATAPYNSYRDILEALLTAKSSVQVTLYEYKPCVGLIYTKESNGQMHYYNYDEYGRLVSISKENAENTTEQMEYYCISNWVAPLSVALTNTISSLSIGSKTFGVRSSGGSGDYTYSLKIMRGNTILKSGSTSSITYNFTTPGTYTFSGWVEDNITSEKIEFSHSFTIEQPVILPVISFTEKVQHVYESYGNYYSTAIIECEEATTVEFSFSATLDQGSYSVIIGDNTVHSGAYNSDEKISVDLEAGTNYVELRLYNASNAELYLIMSEAEGAEIGSDPTLTVSTERAEY